jgi:histidyl-tRNA synthetase
VVVIPADAEHNLASQKVAKEIRDANITVTTDIGTKKIGKKISDAADNGAKYIVVVGEDEVSAGKFVLKKLTTGKEFSGTVAELAKAL